MIRELQKLLNKWGITDDSGKPLVEDGIQGKKTNQAIRKAKELLTIILE